MATEKTEGKVADVLTITERVTLQHALGMYKKSLLRAISSEPKQSEIVGIREKQVAAVEALNAKLM